MGHMQNRLLSVDEEGKYLGVRSDSVYRRIVKKSMPANRMGHLRKFKKEVVGEWGKPGGAVDLSKKDLHE